jgi:hypothetical protein
MKSNKILVALILVCVTSFARAADIIPAKRTIINVSGGGSDPTKLPLAGGTMTGDIIMSGGTGVEFSTSATGSSAESMRLSYTTDNGGHGNIKVPVNQSFDFSVINFISSPTAGGFVLLFSTQTIFDSNNTFPSITMSTSGRIQIESGANGDGLNIRPGDSVQLSLGGGAEFMELNSTRTSLSGGVGTQVTVQNQDGQSITFDKSSTTVGGAEVVLNVRSGGRLYMNSDNWISSGTQINIGEVGGNFGNVNLQPNGAVLNVQGTTNKLDISNLSATLRAPAITINGTTSVSILSTLLELGSAGTIHSAQPTGKAVCWNASGNLSTCTSVVGAGGGCTCP